MEIERYQNKWSNFDENATGYIEISHLPELLFQLGTPLGWDNTFKENKES
jgi:Ca2+-binding EF-hand superfamily protein